MYSNLILYFVMLVKKFIVLLFLMSSITGYAKTNLEKFEGSINLRRETIYDTSFVTIKVKGNMVRVDEFDNRKNLTSIYLIDLDNESVLALSPKQKLFYELKASNISTPQIKDTVVIRTQNTMMVEGRSCSQMRVRCKSSDTEVAFWVTESNFDFFTKMNSLLRKVKPDIDFFSYFPDEKGLFPMLIVERTLLRKEKFKVLVTAINSTPLSEALFRIPLDYQKIVQ